MKAVLDVRRLLVLRAVAQHGSLAAAARELGYSQPAVSHHIHRLEAETGVRLIIRDGRGVTLTEAGRALVARADTIAAELAAAEAQLAAFARTAAGHVRLAALPSSNATLVPAALAHRRTCSRSWRSGPTTPCGWQRSWSRSGWTRMLGTRPRRSASAAAAGWS